MNRLFISNSKYLFLSVIFFVLCGLALTEIFYHVKNVQIDYGKIYTRNIEYSGNTKNTIVVLGDSRASAAFVPQILNEKIYGSKTYNIGARGGVLYGMMNSLAASGKSFKLVIICVSPASLFGAFVHDSVSYRLNTVDLSTPYDGDLNSRINDKLSSYLKCLKFNYGFTELKNLIVYGQTSRYVTLDGWDKNIWLGSASRYARTYNYYGYKYRLLCNSQNKDLLEKLKKDFSEILKSVLINSNIILIRLPVSTEMHKLEYERFPWFDDFLSELSDGNKIKYINGFDGEFMSDPFNDGSHLTYFNAIRFSYMISDTLNNYLSH